MDKEQLPNIEKLKEAIDTAEKVLIDMEEDDDGKSKRKKKRIKKALDKAYEMLTKPDYTQKEVDKRTDEIWEALMDDDHFLALIIFFFGFALSGAIIFTIFQAYSFIQTNWDPEIKRPELTDDISDLISVNYEEENIVSLFDQMTVSDKVGLKNEPEKFLVSNDSSKIGAIDYLVHYSVNLVPMNDPNAKLIDKKFIKYKYSYDDSKTGKHYESNIGTLADLTVNPDGSLLLTKEIQKRDSVTNYNVVFWISSLAGNDQQGATYTFAFKVNAAIARS